MNKTLLPCPFCGGEANLDELTPTPYNDQHSTYYSVGCINCGIGFYENTKDEATAAWNRRADARQLALKTRVCPMCEDCPDGCPVETPKDSRNIVTNADAGECFKRRHPNDPN